MHVFTCNYVTENTSLMYVSCLVRLFLWLISFVIHKVTSSPQLGVCALYPILKGLGKSLRPHQRSYKVKSAGGSLRNVSEECYTSDEHVNSKAITASGL